MAVACLAVLVTGLLIAFAVTTPAAKQPVTRADQRAHTTAARDPVRHAITSLASALVGGGLAGDPALAFALDATAAHPVGPVRTASAERTLSLAQALLKGGGISTGQYQAVVSTLGATGATPPTTTTTIPTTPPAPHAPAHPGHDHQGDGSGDGSGGGPGDQG